MEATYALASAWSPFDDPEWTLSIAQFDPSLGTLTQVSITLSGQIVADVSMTNNDPSGNTLQATWSTNLTLNRSTTELVVTPLTAEQTHVFAGTGTATYSEATDSAVIGPTASETAMPGDLTPYIGTGVVAHAVSVGTAGGADYSYDTVSLSGKPLFTDVDGNFHVSGSVTVTYIYTPVPEPSALLLLGLFAIPAFAWRRRQRQTTVTPAQA